MINDLATETSTGENTDFQDFEDYLKERFMEDAPEEVGCKDDFEDNFERWVLNLDVQELIDYSNKFKRN